MNASTSFRDINVFAAGGAHIDRRGRSSTAFRAGASNPGRMTEAVGGAAFNAVRAARSLGAGVRLVSARGGDHGGTIVRTALAQLEVEDIALTWLDRQTPTYTALLDDDGELVGGLADMELYDLMRPRVFDRRHIRDALAGSHAVLVDTNLPAGAIERLIERAGGAPVFAIGVSPAKVGRLRDVLPRFAAVFLSSREAARLVGSGDGEPPAGIAERLIEAGCRRAVITAGPDAAAIVDNGGTSWQPPPRVAAVRDVTGAGDTLAGVAMLAFVAGFPFGAAVRFGMAAASLHVSLGRRDGDLTLADVASIAEALPPPTLHPSNERTETA